MDDVRAIVIISLTIIPFLIMTNIVIISICALWSNEDDDGLKTVFDDYKVKFIASIVLLIIMWAGGLCVMILKNQHTIIESIIIGLWIIPLIIIFIRLVWGLIKWLWFKFKKQASKDKTS